MISLSTLSIDTDFEFKEMLKKQKMIVEEFCNERAKKVIYTNPKNLSSLNIPFPAQEYRSYLAEKITISAYLKHDYKFYLSKYGLPLAVISITVLAIPRLGGATSFSETIDFYKNIAAEMWDNTAREVQCVDWETGEKFVRQTSNRQDTIFGFIVFGTVPMMITYHKLGSYIQSLKNDYSNTGQLSKVFIPRFYGWRINIIKEIYAKHAIPAEFETDPDLASFKCSITKKVFVFPVKTPHNKVFEHYKIEEHLNNNCTCPLTHNKLYSAELEFDETTYNRIRQIVYYKLIART